MDFKLVGGILLIVGTSIGGAMLALPITVGQSGFLGAIILLFSAWLCMTLGAFLILEVNLWFPAGSNLVSMAKGTLGHGGAVFAWLVYLVLLYCLLAAYIAGGSNIFLSLLAALNWVVPHWFAAVSFTLILGFVIYLGIRHVDQVNRCLMGIKFSALIFLIGIIGWHVDIYRLEIIHVKYLVSALTVAITSFGFATIIPSIRHYFDSDIKKLRLAVLSGSLVPLVFYILWIGVILGEIPFSGEHGLSSILRSTHPVSALIQALLYFIHSPWLTVLAHAFTSVCVATSFLGVSLSLSDFIADGFNTKKQGKGQWLVYGATFLPPLSIALLYPAAFIMGLSYAGICCILLLAMLPAAMAWQGRYRQNIQADYRLWGGRLPLIVVILFGSLIVVSEIVN